MSIKNNFITAMGKFVMGTEYWFKRFSVGDSRFLNLCLVFLLFSKISSEWHAKNLSLLKNFHEIVTQLLFRISFLPAGQVLVIFSAFRVMVFIPGRHSPLLGHEYFLSQMFCYLAIIFIPFYLLSFLYDRLSGKWAAYSWLLAPEWSSCSGLHSNWHWPD